MADNPLGEALKSEDFSVETLADGIKAKYGLDGAEPEAEPAEEIQDKPTEDVEPTEAHDEIEPEAEETEQTPLDDLQAEAESEETLEQEAEAPDAEGDEPEVEAQELEPIDAPVSWPEADKEAFRGLPPALQELVAERESEREGNLTRVSQDFADKSRDIEEYANQVSLERQYFAEHLAPFIQSIGTDLEGSQANLDALFNRYQESGDGDDQLAYEGAKRDLEKKQADHARLIEERDRIAHQQHNEAVRANNAKVAESAKTLARRIPEWGKDDKLAAAEIKDLRQFVQSQYEVAPEVANGIYDAALIEMARDAKAYRALQKGKPNAKRKLKGKPPVAKPGTVSSKAEVNEKQRGAMVTNLRKTNSVDALADVLKSAGV